MGSHTLVEGEEHLGVFLVNGELQEVRDIVLAGSRQTFVLFILREALPKFARDVAAEPAVHLYSRNQLGV